ncbi:unnamed protein product [Dicrocoelium dendriticum]|nr:unnamed protein product [Dicrocoelium dendriticum]
MTSRSRKSQQDPAIPRGSQYIDGQLIHTATKQKLFFNTHVCTVYRHILNANERFVKLKAEQIMSKHMKKRQAHGIANILEDRFTIERHKTGGKDPFRPYLYYREIEDIQRSKRKPKYFVLSIQSEISGKKYYEVYKCKLDADAAKFEKYIRQAMEDEEKKVRDTSYLAVVPVAQPVDNRRSILNLDFLVGDTSDEEDEEHEDDDDREEEKRDEPAVVEMEEVKQVAQQPSPYPPIEVERQTVIPVAASAESRLIAPSPVYAPSFLEMEHITYIFYECTSGRPIINDVGPFYMYCVRRESEYSRHSTDLNDNTALTDFETYDAGYGSDKYYY